MSVVPVTFDDIDLIVDKCQEILKCEKCKEHARKILIALSQKVPDLTIVGVKESD